MKIRADFVTNSSSSCFTLVIDFKLVNGKHIQFDAQGGTDETGRVDYFDGDAIVTVSPKQLGTAASIEEMIQRLTDGVLDSKWDDGIEDLVFIRIFDNNASSGKHPKHDAYSFIKKIRKSIKSMDDIESISIVGDEDNYVSYNRKYVFNRITGEYKGAIEGDPFEKNGSSGGDLRFDISDCNIRLIGEYDED